MRTLSYLANRLITSPLLWGAAAYAAFVFLLKTVDAPGVDFLRRYTTGHPIEYIETLLFFLGLADLLFKAWHIAGEWARLSQAQGSLLDELGPEDLLVHLDQYPPALREHAFFRQLRAGLSFLRRRNSLERLEDHLAAVRDEEAESRRASYGFVRLVIWAIPILGFLGTVVGITLSLGNLAPQRLEETLPAVMSGLMVAFDTTALALSLSMILMLVQYAVDRGEQKLVTAAAERVEGLLFAKISHYGDSPLVRTQDLLGERVVQACEQLVHKQVELWQKSLRARDEQWARLWQELQAGLEKALAAALSEATRQFLDQLGSAAERHREELAAWQRELVEHTRAQIQPVVDSLSTTLHAVSRVEGFIQETTAQWKELAAESRHLANIQDLLQQNLAAVSSAKHFEQALATLAAAANLLSAHLQRLPPERIAFPEGASSKAKAA